MSRCTEKQANYLAVLQYQCSLKDETVKMKIRGNITGHVPAYEIGSKRQLGPLYQRTRQLHAPSSLITSSYLNSMHLLTGRLGDSAKFPPRRSHITLAFSRNKPLLACIIANNYKTTYHFLARCVAYIYDISQRTMRRSFDVLSLFSRDRYLYSRLQSGKTGRSSRTCSNYAPHTSLLGVLGMLCIVVASFMAGRHSVADGSLLTIPCESRANVSVG